MEFGFARRRTVDLIVYRTDLIVVQRSRAILAIVAFHLTRRLLVQFDDFRLGTFLGNDAFHGDVDRLSDRFAFRRFVVLLSQLFADITQSI